MIQSEYLSGFILYFVTVHGFKGSGVQGSILSRSAFGLRIYGKRVSFVKPNPKFGAKLAITWENEHF